MAGAGGLLRNEDGAWIHGFAHNIGIASASMAEFCGVFIGLRRCWNMGYRRIMVEVDSKTVCNLAGGSDTYPV